MLSFRFQTLQSLLQVDLHHAILGPHLINVLFLFAVQNRQKALQFGQTECFPLKLNSTF